MKTQIKKWGNSLAIRLPKTSVELLGLKENSSVSFSFNKDQIIVKPEKQKTFSLKQLTDKITSKNRHNEISTEGIIGKEIW